jgi:hypothetical protein
MTGTVLEQKFVCISFSILTKLKALLYNLIILKLLNFKVANI